MTDIIHDIKTGMWSHVNDTANACQQCTHDYEIVEVWTCKLHNSTRTQLFKAKVILTVPTSNKMNFVYISTRVNTLVGPVVKL